MNCTTVAKPDGLTGYSILNIPGSKMGNRRTANVRSVGYSGQLIIPNLLYCIHFKVSFWAALVATFVRI